MDSDAQTGIRIAQIFLGRSHFEYTVNPFEHPANEPVGDLTTTVQISIGTDDAGDAGFISLTVGTAPESKGLYKFRVEMLAVVERDRDATLSVGEYLRVAGPATVYPFLREAVANLTGRARFGPVWLAPLNFVELGKQLDTQTAEKNKAP